jgi:hypothetical protein
MADDWRVMIAFQDAARVRRAAELLSGHQVTDEARTT